jgi:hypothetical protein
MTWDKIEIVKMPKKHNDLTTYRAFMYIDTKVINIVERDWIYANETEEQHMSHLLWMVQHAGMGNGKD